MVLLNLNSVCFGIKIRDVMTMRFSTMTMTSVV